ncbi:MAG: tetratricopeptide repeat protein [Cyanobacteria bacterium J06639_1]
MKRRVLRAIAIVLVVAFCRCFPVWAAPSENVGHLDRARELIQQGECAAAIAPLSEAVRAHPENAIAFKLRGYCHQKLEQSDAALSDYSRVIALTPKSADAYIDRGLAHGFRGEYELAIADYDEALAIAPEDARASNARGVARCRQGFSGEGRSDFARAAELSRDSGDLDLYRVARRAAKRLCGA